MVVEPPQGFRTSGEPPQGTRIVILRHGEANCNVNGRVGGPKGCTGLSDHGRVQAAALRDRLERTREFDGAVALYSSTLPRAQETLAIVSTGLPNLERTSDCSFCELHPGDGDGLTWDELVATFGGPDWDRDPDEQFAPGGESWLGFYYRCVEAFRELARKHPGQLVIVAAHGGVVEQAVKFAQGLNPAARLQLRTEHCSLTEIELDGDAVRLLRYNDRAPLAVTAR